MSRPEKDRQKQIQDKCMSLLTQMLRDEDNKYCVDCDAKGPRWASWNIGIFLCIRCAGIHRNLGVHISKVKSVNLDTWTPEQVVSLQQMGNSRARAVYEANLPDSFRRPQTDSALESFIRAKYETKKYIAEEWVPPPLPKVNWDKELDEEAEKTKKKKREGKGVASVPIPVPKKIDSVIPQAIPKPSNSPKNSRGTPPPRQARTANASADLLGLTTPTDDKQQATAQSDDFTNFLSAPPLPSAAPSAKKSEEATTFRSEEEDSFFNQTDLGGGHGGLGFASAGGKMTTDSILALYGKTQSQPQVPTFQGGPHPGVFPAQNVPTAFTPNFQVPQQVQYPPIANGAMPGVGMGLGGLMLGQPGPTAAHVASNPFYASALGGPQIRPAADNRLFQDFSGLSLQQAPPTEPKGSTLSNSLWQ
ncbi:stromal membrane-associated protein [Nesidiocoris tenuis]|uniref:Stromal membrane-associated protein n=1 Tax=Nesidiocoris tenuis TaxID=355587 RepID=A0ABN7BES9_9HEMI|nr:stromal membrane-associated protein [Nesidiocoris tenuis]